MKRRLPTSAVMLICVAVNIMLHVLVQNNAASYLPISLVLANVLLWAVPAPGYYLIGLLAASEIFSTQPGGTLTLSIFAPLLVKRLWAQEVNFSLTFAAALFVCVAIQLGVWQGAMLLATLGDWTAIKVLLNNVPWLTLAWSWLLIGTLSFIETVIIANYLPAPSQVGRPWR